MSYPPVDDLHIRRHFANALVMRIWSVRGKNQNVSVFFPWNRILFAVNSTCELIIRKSNFLSLCLTESG